MAVFVAFVSAGCEVEPPGLCRSAPLEESACFEHGGEGYLSGIFLPVSAIPSEPLEGRFDPQAEMQNETATRLESTQLLTWSAEPTGYARVQSVGAAGERTYLFSPHDGRLRRGHWKGGKLNWEDKDVQFGRGFSGFVVAQLADYEEGGVLVDVAIFVDPYIGRAEAWRVSGEIEQLWVDEGEDWKGRRELSVLPSADMGAQLLAHAPEAAVQLQSPISDAAVQMAARARADLRAYTRRGARRFELVYERTRSEDNFATRLRINRLDAEGQPEAVLWEAVETTAWSQVRLLAKTEGEGIDDRVSELWLWRYRAEDGASEFTRVDPESGATLKSTHEIHAIHWTDVDVSMNLSGDTLRVLGLSEEGIRPLSAEGLGAMVAALRERLSQRPGYQVVLMQSGHIIFEEAAGWARIPSGAAPLGQPMTPDVRQNVASISKLVTAITFLRLSDRGKIDLDASFLSTFSSSVQEEAHASWSGLTTRELLTHSTALQKNACDRDGEGRPDCRAVLNEAREMWRCETNDDGHACCPRQYNNANFQLARGVLEDTFELKTNAALAARTREEWMNDIGIEGASCEVSDDVAYYRNLGTQSPEWDELRPTHGGGCDESGWQLSANDLARLARAIRYNWLFTPETSELLTGCGEYGWLGWDAPWTNLSAHSKNGRLNSDTWGVQTVTMQLPRHLDLVIVLNSVSDPGLETIVGEIWSAF